MSPLSRGRPAKGPLPHHQPPSDDGALTRRQTEACGCAMVSDSTQLWAPRAMEALGVPTQHPGHGRAVARAPVTGKPPGGHKWGSLPRLHSLSLGDTPFVSTPGLPVFPGCPWDGGHGAQRCDTSLLNLDLSFKWTDVMQPSSVWTGQGCTVRWARGRGSGGSTAGGHCGLATTF